MSKIVIPNQVFVGCPWKTTRQKYEKIINGFNKKYPLLFVIIGRDSTQDAKDLLQLIKTTLLSSSYAIFDATGGNANVSLEYGMAEGNEVPRAIYFSEHKKSKESSGSGAIISDLAGKTRNVYKNQERLKKLLNSFCKEHSYTKQFEKFLKKVFSKNKYKKGKKLTFRKIALKIIHKLDNVNRKRREDIVFDLRGEGYKEKDIDSVIKLLHKGNLVVCERGRFSALKMK